MVNARTDAEAPNRARTENGGLVMLESTTARRNLGRFRASLRLGTSV